MSTPSYGPKLQALMANGCIDATRAAALSAQQLEAIEGLSWIEIGTLIEAHLAVGAVPNGSMI